jgi:CRP/FNR family transcriptional regulator, anaerobic regulatory protein
MFQLISQIMNCETCTAQNCFILKYVKPEWLTKISENKHVMLFKKGQIIFYEANLVMGLFFIKEGKVKIFFTREHKDQIIRLANTGDILGHRGLGGDDRYPISAIALEESQICFLPKRIMLEQLQNNSSFSYQFTMFYASELMKSEQRWHSLSRTGLRERVINAILMSVNAFHDDIIEGDVINMHLTRKEIGEIASTSPEQVSREFTWLKEEGLIDIIGRKKIIIKDYNKFKNFSTTLIHIH